MGEAKSACPYCAGRKVFPGLNDLAASNPSLADEWDVEVNGDLSPGHVRSLLRSARPVLAAVSGSEDAWSVRACNKAPPSVRPSS